MRAELQRQRCLRPSGRGKQHTEKMAAGAFTLKDAGARLDLDVHFERIGNRVWARGAEPAERKVVHVRICLSLFVFRGWCFIFVCNNLSDLGKSVFITKKT